MVWAWACPSVVRSPKRTAGDCGRPRTPRGARPFSLRCIKTMKPEPVKAAKAAPKPIGCLLGAQFFSTHCAATQLRRLRFQHRGHAGRFRFRQIVTPDFNKRATSLGMTRVDRLSEATFRHQQIKKRRCPRTVMDLLV